MSYFFLIKERLKFSFILTLIGAVLGALVTWYFWNQLEFETDRSRFLLSATITGSLSIAAVGLLFVFKSANQVVDPSHSFTDRFDSISWRFLKVIFVFVVIVGAGFFIIRNRGNAQGEFELLRSGQFEMLVEQIESYPNVLEKTDLVSGRTLLQVAYQENLPEAVRLLISQGASVTGLDAQGRSPVVASLQNLPMLEVLLEGGISPEDAGPEGIPPLHYAVATDALPALDLLLKANGKINVRDQIFRTPMMRAAEGGNLPMVGKLIELGSDPDAFDRRGDTALHLAVRRCNPEMVRLLLEEGADPRIFNFIHMTPLHLAASAGQSQLVSLFLEQPDMTGLVDEAGQTPFDLALQARKYETVQLLIDGGADINRIYQDGRTQLHRTILVKDYSTSQFLIRVGADVTIEDKTGRTALDIIQSKEFQGLEELIAARDNPDAITNTVDNVVAP